MDQGSFFLHKFQVNQNIGLGIGPILKTKGGVSTSQAYEPNQRKGILVKFITLRGRVNIGLLFYKQKD